VEVFEKLWASLVEFLGDIMQKLGEENIAQSLSLIQVFNDITEES